MGTGRCLVKINNMADGSEKVVLANDPNYVDPIEDPYNKAIGYLEKHNILQIFQHLTSDVIFHRPKDPLDYLIQEVQQMKEKNEQAKQSQKQ